MKKYATFVIILLIAVASAFLSVNRETVTADDVVSSSLEKMLKAASFEAEGIVCHQTDGAGIRHSEVTTEVKVDLEDPGLIRAQIDIDIDGTKTENYMIGDMMYVNVPQCGWKKAPLSMFEPGSPFLFQNITELMQCAENPVLEEKETEYVITFDVNSEEYRDSTGDVLADATESGKNKQDYTSNNGLPEEETVTRTTIYVDKETLLVKRALEEEVHLLPSGGDFEREILTTTEYKYFNYDSPVSISLPEEAELAPFPRK